MDGPRDYHTKRSKSERERQIPYNITYIWNLIMTQMNISTKQKQTDIENRCVVVKEEGRGGGMDWEFGISRCKLLYTGYINNKVLQYSTGNYIQYPVINHNGKEYIYIICITESLCCTAEINNIVNQLYINLKKASIHIPNITHTHTYTQMILV